MAEKAPRSDIAQSLAQFSDFKKDDTVSLHGRCLSGRPPGGSGGFNFCNAHNGVALDFSKCLLTLKEQVATFAESIQSTGATFGGDVTVQNGGTYWMHPATIANNLTFGLSPIDSYTAGIKSNIGATVSFRVSGDLQSTGGSDGNGSLQSGGNTVISGLHPDGAGGWQTTSSSTVKGGTLALANYTLANLPSQVAPSATLGNGGIAFCTDYTDCKLNGVTGV